MDIIKYGNWTLLEILPITDKCRRKCRCQCECGTVKEMYLTELKSGRTVKCKSCCQIKLDNGFKAGCYTVIAPAGPNPKRSLCFKCLCVCGKESIVPGVRLRKKPPDFCKNCKGLQKAPIGQKFGEWTVLGFGDIYKYKTRWKVKCSCGEESLVNSGNILTKKTTKCYRCKNSELKNKRGRCFSVNINESSENSFDENLAITQIPPVFWKRLIDNANRRSIKFEINEGELIALFNEQKGKCALTGLSLKLEDNSKKCTASVDRIDSEHDYEIGNLQFVHKHVNLMKNAFTQEYFLKLCDLVSSFSKNLKT